MAPTIQDFDAAKLGKLSDAAGEFGQDGILPEPQFVQINAGGSEGDAAMFGFAAGGDGMSGVEKRFRGDAATVEADAAEFLILFDENNFFAKVGSVKGSGVSSGSRADDNDLGFDGVHGVGKWSGGVVEKWSDGVME